MHDLEPGRADARLAETAQPRAARQGFLLRAEKWKNRSVRNPSHPTRAQQRAPPAEDDVGELHLAFDDGAVACPQRPIGRTRVRSS